MGKFLKKFSDFVKERKESIAFKVMAGTSFSLEQTWKLYFWCLKGYLKGKPNNKLRLVWNSVIIQVVDSDSTCDDEGFVGMKIKERCRLIGKEKIISSNNLVWIEKELIPYFENSLKNQVLGVNEMMMEQILKGEITPDEAKAAYGVYSKNEKKFMGALK